MSVFTKTKIPVTEVKSEKEVIKIDNKSQIDRPPELLTPIDFSRIGNICMNKPPIHPTVISGQIYYPLGLCPNCRKAMWLDSKMQLHHEKCQ